ncbi:MAG: hypothetical protein NPIRA05_15750 [Nitrospirales bacterium]|nr:MAG: hypothetical protein NPIRA05_15750 [Nitrospirales bacterium]
MRVQLRNMIKPLKKTMLGISLIHGRLRALSVIKDQVVANWESPDDIETAEQLHAALQDAVRETQYQGQKVSFLIEDERFVHQYLQVPAMKPADLRLYLKGVVEELKPWKGSTSWRFRTTQEARGKVGVLVDIWPKEFVDEVIAVCRSLDLTPMQLTPLSSIFVEQVRSLPLENNDVVLLVTLMSDKIVLLVAKGDGTPLFERFLSPTRDGVDPSERIGREITRSILFCAQQFGINVSQVWMVGMSENVSASSVQPFTGLTIMQSPMNPDPAYWIWVSLSLPVQSLSNFTSYEMRLAPLRQMCMKLTAAAVLGFLLLGVGLTSFFQGRLVREQDRAIALASESKDLQKEKEAWSQRVQELTAQEVKVQHIIGDRPHPLPGWMLGYLGNVLPSDLTLKEAKITYKANEWMVELSGMAPGDLVEGSRTLTVLEERLKHGPFHVEFVEDWRGAWIQEASGLAQQEFSSWPRKFSMLGRIQG